MRSLLLLCTLTLVFGSTWATPGGSFSLTRTDGSSFSLKSLRGQVVVLSFGYTSCSDICPTTLSTVSAMMRALGPRKRQVVPVFISVDLRRDTPGALRTYLDYFHESLIGLTGTKEQLQQVAERYGTFIRYRGDVKSGNYTVDHTGSIYVIDRKGEVARIVPSGMPPSQLVESVQDVLKESVNQPAPAKGASAG